MISSCSKPTVMMMMIISITLSHLSCIIYDVMIYYIWESKQYFFPCLSESVGFSGDFYQILGSLIESKYLGTSSPGIEVFHRWVKWREGMLKNMQPWKRATDWFTADFKIGPSIVTRLSEPILYGGEMIFVWGWIWTGSRPEATRGER